MYELLAISGTLLLSVGILLYFVGVINTIIIAFGRKHTTFAIFMVIINPLAIIYCLRNWKVSKTQGWQLIIGFVITSTIAFLIYYNRNSFLRWPMM